jgi:hypothetical protein
MSDCGNNDGDNNGWTMIPDPIPYTPDKPGYPQVVMACEVYCKRPDVSYVGLVTELKVLKKQLEGVPVDASALNRALHHLLADIFPNEEAILFLLGWCADVRELNLVVVEGALQEVVTGALSLPVLNLLIAKGAEADPSLVTWVDENAKWVGENAGPFVQPALVASRVRTQGPSYNLRSRQAKGGGGE